LPGAAEIKFRHHLVDPEVEGGNWGQLAIADLDRDGKPDIVVGQSHWGNPNAALYSYRNTGRIGQWEDKALLGKENISDCGIFAADVDGDGWTDIISSAVWYRNPGAVDGKRLLERYVYDKRLAATPRSGAHDVMAADLDGSGRLSVIWHVGGRQYKGFYLYKVPAQSTGEWPRTELATVAEQHGAIAPRGIGDLNGNGRPDFVYIDRWFENLGNGWKQHANLDFGRSGKFGVCARSWVADMDGDKHMDIIQSDCDVDEARVAWFRNVRGDGSQWEKHVLPEESVTGGYHSLAVADFDGDGDLDVFVDEIEHIFVPPARANAPGMYVWENLDGKGRRWKKQTIVSGFGGHEARVADLNGDGRLDVVTKSYKIGTNRSRAHVSVLENLSTRPE
jgi:hypothetical protein